MTALNAHVVVAARRVDAEVTVGLGRTLVLLGANGSGKSTMLEAIAGSIPVDDGAISVDGRTLVGGGRVVSARDRRIGLLTQDDALFPTMSVRDNIAFGPRSQGRFPRHGSGRCRAMA